MRRGFGRHRHTELAAAGQVLERQRRAQVAEVEAAALVARDLEVARHVGALGDGRDAAQAELADTAPSCMTPVPMSELSWAWTATSGR